MTGALLERCEPGCSADEDCAFDEFCLIQSPSSSSSTSSTSTTVFSGGKGTGTCQKTTKTFCQIQQPHNHYLVSQHEDTRADISISGGQAFKECHPGYRMNNGALRVELKCSAESVGGFWTLPNGSPVPK